MRVFATTLLLLALSVLPRLAQAEDMNACGCYHDESGACKCTNKKAKCVCPGDCEPVSCEAKRQKDASREAEATLKKIQLREKKKAAEAAKEAKARTKKPKKENASYAEPGAKDKPKDEVDKLLEGH
jgi:hypothetical protein